MDCSAKYRFSIDLIVLAGYMRIVYPPLLHRFKNQIINIHPGDLTSEDKSKRRMYAGHDAVYQALSQGEKRTRSSVILADEGLDTGPIIVSGPWVDYEGGYPATRETAKLHQDKQKSQSDWPAAIAAVKLISQGRMGIDRDLNVYVDGIVQPKGGYVLTKSS